MVEICRHGCEGGGGEEEAGDVVVETHEAAQVSSHVSVT